MYIFCIVIILAVFITAIIISYRHGWYNGVVAYREIEIEFLSDRVEKIVEHIDKKYGINIINDIKEVLEHEREEENS